MRIQLRNKYLSRPRYNRYLTAVGGDQSKALRLYNANTRLAQAFHPVLSQFEVVFRNSLNKQLVRHFRDTDWIINEKAGFMSHPSLGRNAFYLKREITKSENKFIRRRIRITSQKIIADQNFGFWVALFLPIHYSLVAGQSIYTFPNKPTTITRSNIYNNLLAIKNIRNRINHCEPICFSRRIVDCTKALEVRNKMFDLIEWIDPDLIPFFKKLDNIQNKINNITRI